jgi:hypothetical protein
MLAINGAMLSLFRSENKNDELECFEATFPSN